MSREWVQRKALDSTVGAMAQAVDVDAEHDPAVSRRASNAALRREAVQMKAGGESREPVHEAAQRGVQSPSRALPHADTIQRAFGAHDISQIQAHVGDGSAAAMGAQAYATGNHVVFDKEPDLHTAAHEAAHVVQQAQGVNLYGGVGEAGDAYERNADEVADRVVQGKSAEDLLGTPTQAGAQAGVVQAKEAPQQGQVDGGVALAVGAHVRLTGARVNAGAVKIEKLLEKGGGLAGPGRMLEDIASEMAVVHDDLDNLRGEISRVPNMYRHQLKPDLRVLNGAVVLSWFPALSRVYRRTHNEDGKLSEDAQGLNLVFIPEAREMAARVYRAAGLEEGEVGGKIPLAVGADEAVEQRDEELKAAELEALKWGMRSVETSLELIKADLHSSVADQSAQANALYTSVEQLVNVLEPIDPEHIGKIEKLPILIKQVEALQAEIMQMKDAGEDKGKALASKIGYNTQLSRNLYRLKQKISAIKAEHKSKRKKR